MKPARREKRPDKRRIYRGSGEGACVRLISPTDFDVGRWWEDRSEGIRAWRADRSDVTEGVVL